MVPMFIISVALAITAFYTANNLIPKANLSWGALLYDVTQKKPAMNIVDNVFFKDIDGYAIRVGKKGKDNQSISDVIIYVDDNRGGNNNILIAKKGKMVIRRGFEINPGEKVLIVEDVITTGGSVKEVVEIVEEAKGNIIGVGVLVDRSNGTAKIHPKQYSITSLNLESFDNNNVPSDLAKIPIQKPGSKYSK